MSNDPVRRRTDLLGAASPGFTMSCVYATRVEEASGVQMIDGRSQTKISGFSLPLMTGYLQCPKRIAKLGMCMDQTTARQEWSKTLVRICVPGKDGPGKYHMIVLAVLCPWQEHSWEPCVHPWRRDPAVRLVHARDRGDID